MLCAQPDILDVAKWVTELSDRNDRKNQASFELKNFLLKQDSSSIISYLDKWEKEGSTDNNYFKARFSCLKARFLYYLNFAEKSVDFEQKRVKTKLPQAQKKIEQLLANAIDKAYSSEDEYLVAFISTEYAQIVNIFDMGAAVMYSMNSINLYEKLGVDISPGDYEVLTLMLYKVKAYNDCIKYCHKTLVAWQKTPGDIKPRSCINTIGLAYQKQNLYDSAFKYYRQALQLCYEQHDTTWAGIVSGNMAQIYYSLGKYDIAYALFKFDYDVSLPRLYYDEAANAKQWMARINLALGNSGKALEEVRAAFQLLKLWNNANYLRNAYYTATQVFKTMGDYDSAFYYNNLYFVLNDSLEKEVNVNSLSISRARLNDQVSRYNMQALNREKKAQVTTRNVVIAGTVLVSLLALLVINRKRMKVKLKMEKAEQEKLFMEQEVVAAREQLKLFTDNIVEKSGFKEKLEQQLETKGYNEEQHQVIQELISQSILTNGDWLKFKDLFEKAYPGFFSKLKKQVDNITLAEIRMAALTRLHLNTKQMADVLGISSNSVIKAKQRLRQRFNLDFNYEVEEFIAKL